MDEKLLEMLSTVLPQLGDNAMWVFVIFWVFKFLTNVIWALALAVWPWMIYKSVKKVRETKNACDLVHSERIGGE